jgi:hypothetical protein
VLAARELRVRAYVGYSLFLRRCNVLESRDFSTVPGVLANPTKKLQDTPSKSCKGASRWSVHRPKSIQELQYGTRRLRSLLTAPVVYVRSDGGRRIAYSTVSFQRGYNTNIYISSSFTLSTSSFNIILGLYHPVKLRHLDQHEVFHPPSYRSYGLLLSRPGYAQRHSTSSSSRRRLVPILPNKMLRR